MKSSKSIERGTFTDERDGMTYEWIMLQNGKKWMASNLRFDPKMDIAVPSDNKSENILKFGLLYGWEEALKSIPNGWRLPTKEDVDALINMYVEGLDCYVDLIEGGDSGFNANLGGNCVSLGKKIFEEFGIAGYYWTSTPAESEFMHVLKFDGNLKDASISSEMQEMCGFSVRCIQD